MNKIMNTALNGIWFIVQTIGYGLGNFVKHLFNMIGGFLALTMLLGYPCLFFLPLILTVHYAEHGNPNIYWWCLINVVQLFIAGLNHRDKDTHKYPKEFRYEIKYEDRDITIDRDITHFTMPWLVRHEDEYVRAALYEMKRKRSVNFVDFASLSQSMFKADKVMAKIYEMDIPTFKTELQKGTLPWRDDIFVRLYEELWDEFIKEE